MKPIKFEGMNITYAADQEPYIPLPAYLNRKEGIVTSCWELSFKERVLILFGKNIYHHQLTYCKPPMPIKLEINPCPNTK
jgi:hypothetical protein